MSQNREKNQFRRRWPEWLLPAFFLPSWLMSLGFHMIVFVGVALFFQRAGVTDGNDDSGRVVEIFVKDAEDSPENQTETADSQDAAETVTETVPEETLIDNFLDEPPPLENIFAAGPPSELPDFPTVEQVRPAQPARTPNALSAGRGGTSFMNIKDKGTRFVFVIDCSGSMYAHNAIRVAKAELKKSISLLEATQQFQVIYYNSNAFPWNRRGRSQDVYWANDTNKRLVFQFIEGRGTNGGTEHMPALMMGLKLAPDVIYFLTDADNDDRISAGDLARITHRNGGRTRIHCIEFGIGPKQLELKNFLTELARKNGGSYRYLNVKEFTKRPR